MEENKKLQPRKLPDGTMFHPLGVITRQKEEVKDPDWTFWLAMPHITAWQACALSLNIDPDSLKLKEDTWMNGSGGGVLFESSSFPSKEVEQEFNKRLRLLSEYIEMPRLFHQHPLNLIGNPATHKIRLTDFCEWAASMKPFG